MSTQDIVQKLWNLCKTYCAMTVLPIISTLFAEFIEGYNDTIKRTGKRWSKVTREEIETLA